MKRLVLRSLLILALTCFATGAAANPLRLADVLRSAEQMHPDLHVAEAEVEQARAGTLAARGAFDLELYAEGGHAPVGKYGKPRAAVGVNQPTTMSGIALWARYENGSDFAPYDGGLVTSEAGRASLGIIVPLLQGRAIDKGRLGRMVSELELDIAREQQRQMRARVLAEAATHWWRWVIVGNKLEAYRKLLQQAEQRREFLEEQVQAGALPRIELVDNRRLHLGRRARLSSLELEFRQLSLKLGLYRRDERGEPLPARASELPPLPWVSLPEDLEPEWFRETLKKAPGLQIYDLSLNIVDRELGLAKNQEMPKLDLEIFSSRSFGAPRPYSAFDSSVTETTAGGKLKLAWDVQRREARGKAGILRSKRSALESKKRLLYDNLSLSLQSFLASLRTQQEVADLSREATSEARRVSEAEREGFEMGQSSVLSVNLREQAVLSTYLDELDAIFEFHNAWIRLQELLGSVRTSDYLPPTSRADEAKNEE